MNQLRESHTWWLRLEIARQLPDFAAVLSSQAVLSLLSPLFLTLLTDSVCSVREMTYDSFFSLFHAALTRPTRSSTHLSTQIRSAACFFSTN